MQQINYMSENPAKMVAAIEGQLNAEERGLITSTILNAPVKPKVAVEVGTWLGGGSTLHILRALQKNGEGHLWGVEASKEIYKKMIASIRAGAPEAADRFTPLLGFSTEVLPRWLKELPVDEEIDFVFLDGGDNPYEQIEEFDLLAPRVKVDGVLMSHDAKGRKGKWLVPYVSLLDNWDAKVLDISREGVFHARKIKAQPSAASSRAAERRLKMMRLEFVELAARFVPSKICGLVLRALPGRWSRKLTIGHE
jgi:predicted O-methyltransferase YrrM